MAIAGNNGSEAIFEKVAVFDRFVGRFENSTKLQRHRLKVGLHQTHGRRSIGWKEYDYWDWKRGDWCCMALTLSGQERVTNSLSRLRPGGQMQTMR